MEEVLKREYIHWGTDNLKEELWLNISHDRFHSNNVKPRGGLWCSRFGFGLGDWIDYIKRNNYMWDEFLGRKKCCLVKFKENARLAKIDTKEDYLRLYELGYIKDLSETETITINHRKAEIRYTLDYDKLCKDFDLIYINPYLSNELELYRVPSILVFNSNAIEYYKPIQVDYYDEEIIEEGEKKFIQKPNEDYYKFINYINEIFNKLNYSDNFLEELELLKDKLSECIKENFSELGFNIGNEVDINLLIENTISNIYYKKEEEYKSYILQNRKNIVE